ncbi:hypothetical protein [Streptomyces poonensis]|uniref:Transmembrane protein n=1 Tax=Streptomyces poonensis TaxID=68255 RepID=A0A918Q9P8_9ACTN|nr:hypothetical protein [Streptomyces poonensis]GGZ39169.1 hypothetical protein GCM10010365_69890 [Streptomyces poonensis]GLJ93119.1 hypothetical protein GCM10017589_57310 [Streptomyces poonensis]
MRSDDGTVPQEAFDLLQVTAAHLAAVPGLTEAVRTIGADRGIDYLADAEVAAMLHRHRMLLGRMNSCGMWGGLLLAPGAVGAWFLTGTTDWDDVGTAVGLILFTPVVLLLSLSGYLLVRAFWYRRIWLRGGTRDQVNGYLQVLSAAGLPHHSLPVWLRPVTGKRWR